MAMEPAYYQNYDDEAPPWMDADQACYEDTADDREDEDEACDVEEYDQIYATYADAKHKLNRSVPPEASTPWSPSSIGPLPHPPLQGDPHLVKGQEGEGSGKGGGGKQLPQVPRQALGAKLQLSASKCACDAASLATGPETVQQWFRSTLKPLRCMPWTG